MLPSTGGRIVSSLPLRQGGGFPKDVMGPRCGPLKACGLTVPAPEWQRGGGGPPGGAARPERPVPVVRSKLPVGVTASSALRPPSRRCCASHGSGICWNPSIGWITKEFHCRVGIGCLASDWVCPGGTCSDEPFGFPLLGHPTRSIHPVVVCHDLATQGFFAGPQKGTGQIVSLGQRGKASSSTRFKVSAMFQTRRWDCLRFGLERRFPVAPGSHRPA